MPYSLPHDAGSRPTSELRERACPEADNASAGKPAWSPSLSTESPALEDTLPTDPTSSSNASFFRARMARWNQHIRLEVDRHEWWDQEARKLKNRKRWSHLPGLNERRRCTNPIMAFLFVNVWTLYAVVLGYLIMQAPHWRWLRLKDDQGNLCGGAMYPDKPLLTWALDYSLWSETLMTHRRDTSMTLIEWIEENPEDWPLVEDQIYEQNMLMPLCVSSCKTSSEPHHSIFPRILDCQSDDPTQCLTLPEGLNRPVLGALCYPNSPFFRRNPLGHPLVLEALTQSYSWVAVILSHSPLTLSDRSLRNLSDVATGISMIPIALFLSVTFSVATLSLLKYINRPLILTATYAPPILCLTALSWGILMVVKSSSSSPPLTPSLWSDIEGDAPSKALGIFICVVSTIAWMVTSLLLCFVRSRVKPLVSLTKSASSFLNQTLLSVLPALTALFLSTVVWLLIMVGILSRLVLVEYDHSNFKKAVDDLAIDSDPFLELFFDGRFSTFGWIASSLLLGIWTSAMLRGWARIAVALMVKQWMEYSTLTRSDDTTLSKSPSTPVASVDAEPRSVPSSSSSYRVFVGMKDAMYHLGTAIWGGLLLAISGSLRWVVKVVLTRLEKAQAKMKQSVMVGDVVPSGVHAATKACCSWKDVLTSVLHGLRVVLAVVDRAIRFLTDQTYIHAALLNQGFFRGAYGSFLLMLREGGSVLSVVLISRVLAFTLISVTSILVTGLVWFCVFVGMSPSLEGHGTYLFLCCFLLSWIVNSSVYSVNSAVVDTLLHIRLIYQANESDNRESTKMNEPYACSLV